MDRAETLVNGLAARGISVARDLGALCLTAERGAITPEDVADLKRNKPAILALLAKDGPSHAEVSLHPLPEQAAILRAFGGGAHLVSAFFTLDPAPSIHAARSAIGAVVRRHDAFTLRLETVDAGALRLHSGGRVCAPRMVDLTGTDPSLRQAVFDRIMADALRCGIDLHRSAGLRIFLATRSGRVEALSLVTHHAVMDRWSMDVLASELQAALECHEGGAPWPAAPAPSYVRFVATRPVVSSAPSDMAPADDSASLDLYPDRGGAAPIGAPARHHRAEFDHMLIGALHRHGRRSAVIAAALAIVLRRYSETERLALGVPVAGRTDPAVQDLVGLISHTAVLRPSLSFRQTGRGLITDLGRCLDRILTDGPEGGDAAVDRLPQVLLSFQTAAMAAGSGRFRPVFPRKGVCKTDLVVFASETSLTLEYPAEGFAVDRIAGLAADILDQMRSLLGDPDRRLADCDPPPRGIAPGQPPSRPAPVLELVRQQALARPDAIAVEDRSTTPARQISYRQLLRRVAAIAEDLRARGVCADSAVALALTNPLERITAALAVLWAGGGYAPVGAGDRAEPRGLTLTDDAVEPGPPETLRLGTLGRATAGPLAGPAPVPRCALAWSLPTSGSTGPAKRVALERSNADAFVDWARHAYAASDLRRVLAVTPAHFDLSVFEMLAPLAVGGTVVALESPLALARDIAAAAPSLINTTPSIFRDFLATGVRLDPGTVVNLAGEVVDAELLRAARAAGVKRLFNLYGPSEATTYASWAPVDLDASPRRAPIGQPIAGWDIRLDRGAGARGADLWRGELTIGGAGVGRGYFDAPAATAAAFVPDPDGAPGRRRYRTGDRAFWDEAGQLHFLGRADRQIKRRGMRVELDGIEAALRADPAVMDAAVRIEQTGRGPRIIAYLVAADLAQDALRARLARMPPALMPDETVLLQQLPRTRSGKVDRRALASCLPLRKPAKRHALTPVEREIAGIWTDLTGHRVARGSARFFDSGGDSLMLMRLAERLARRFGSRVSPLDLLRHPTVSDMADLVAKGRPDVPLRLPQEASS